LIRYEIIPAEPEKHLFHVGVTLENVRDEQTWQLPAWVPGSYLIRDFARHVIEIGAEADDEPLPLTKLDKHTWQTAAPASKTSVTLRLVIHAHDSSVRAAFLDTRYAFYDGTSVYLLPLGHENAPCEVTVNAPEHPGSADWELATGLTPKAIDARGFGTFTATHYAALIDKPVLMSRLRWGRFEVGDSVHEIVLCGRERADLDRLCRDIGAICRTHAEMFGEVPMASYRFLAHVSGSGRGGIEHRNSSVLAFPRGALPHQNDPPDEVRDAYRDLLGLFSHEYFHSWNVKRIKPAAFTPYDLSRENYTELLWAFEGITSYYDDLGLVRAGVIAPESYLEFLGQTLTKVARRRGRFKQSIGESSFDAWTRFYKQDANAPNAIVSYYTKGAWQALALDLTLRQKTDNEKSLDDVMRLLWQRYGKTGEGVPEQGIQAAAEEVLGEPMAAFFQKAIYGTEDIDPAPLLAPMGVTLNWRGAADHQDSGGKKAEPGLHLGALIAEHPAGVKLRVLYEQGIAMQAGLAPDDVIIALDKLKVTASNLDSLLASYAPGDTVTLDAFRDDELMTVEVPLEPSAPDFAVLDLADDGLTPAGRAWLHVPQR
jgi:predicted metalloprotease with PDZ domain